MVIHFQQNPEETAPVLKFLENAIITVFASHFILRRQIKAHSIYGHFNFKIYAKGIVLASLFYYVIERMNDALFSLMAEKVRPFMITNELSGFIAQMIAAMALFSLWSALYISITSIRDSRQMAQQLKEEQLSSLMNQVNPHFLFNSLNTIRGMIFENQEKAAELVTQLASLFRYNLSLDTRVTVTFTEELQICQQYLAIEAIRLGDRLKVNYDIAPECHQRVIPTMGLQTLVENAIKHGIANLRQGGELTINAAIENDFLAVTVVNPFDKALIKSGTQVGLENLNKRISLLTANQGNLTHEAKDNYFYATMRLPKES
ncbi:sensor histidine kinase [Thalassotalea fusca]